MKETFYFSHDYNARNDERIIKLIQKCGLEGYGIFWILIEKLYESGGLLDKDYDCLAFDMRTDSERIKAVVESGLFEFRNDKFYSKSVNARLVARKGKSEMARQSAKLRWSKPKKDDANAMRTQCDGNAIKESKVKETKGKEISVAVATSTEVKTTKFILEVKKSLEGQSFPENEIQKFCSYWTEPNKTKTKLRWELQPTFEISRRLATWFSRNNNFNNKPKRINL